MNPRDWGRPVPATITREHIHDKPKFPIPELLQVTPYCSHSGTETFFKKKKRAACFNSRNKSSQAIQNRFQEFLLNSHTRCKSSGSKESLWPVPLEMLFQLRNGRQQLLALVTTERQLQELRHPISDTHSASVLYHLYHSL